MDAVIAVLLCLAALGVGLWRHAAMLGDLQRIDEEDFELARSVWRPSRFLVGRNLTHPDSRKRYSQYIWETNLMALAFIAYIVFDSPAFFPETKSDLKLWLDTWN